MKRFNNKKKKKILTSDKNTPHKNTPRECFLINYPYFQTYNNDDGF